MPGIQRFCGFFVLVSFAVLAEGDEFEKIALYKPDNSSFSSDVGLSGCGQSGSGFELAPHIWACPSQKPLKPSRVLDEEKRFCAPQHRICSFRRLAKTFRKGTTGKKYGKRLLKRCLAFRMDDKKKAGGYGGSCTKNFYFDGVLCCKHSGKHALGRKHLNSLSKSKKLNKPNHYIHNLV